MTDRAIIREFRNLPELVEALREAVRLRNTTFGATDELGGLPAIAARFLVRGRSNSLARCRWRRS
jgi:hypothetical protein